MSHSDEIARLLKIWDHLPEQLIVLMAKNRQLIRESRAIRREIERSAWDSMGRKTAR